MELYRFVDSPLLVAQLLMADPLPIDVTSSPSSDMTWAGL